MKTFDPLGKCPKCGSSEVSSQHFNYGRYFTSSDPQRKHFQTSMPPEHIWRHCARCHFGWPEKPIDKLKEAPHVR